MKNKYLTKLLCVTIVSAMLVSGTVSVLAEDAAVQAEEQQSEETPAEPVPEPQPEPDPEPTTAPEPEPEPTTAPDPEPTTAPDPEPTSSPDPTADPTATPAPTNTATPVPTNTAAPTATPTPAATQAAITGTPVYYVSNLHAGNEFYLNSLKENYALIFSDDFASVMDQIEAEFKAANGLTDASDTNGTGLTSSSDSLLVRNWQDILAVYIYEQSQNGVTSYTMDSSCKEDLARIFARMNPLVKDSEGSLHVSYANYHINDYIKENNIAEENRTVLKKYVETDCKLLCAIVTDAKGFVRESVGDDVSEERVNVITAAYSLVGKVGYFWGGKSTAIGMDASWGSAATVSVEGSNSTGTMRAYGLDCSGFVTWAVINGYLNQGMEGVVGNGTSEQWVNAGVVSEQDAQPGDLVFQNGPESGSDNHVGIICGKTDSGDWIAVHCSAGKNGVTVGEAYSASFRYIRQPSFYPDDSELEAMKNVGETADNASETTEAVIEGSGDVAESTAETTDTTETTDASDTTGNTDSSDEAADASDGADTDTADAENPTAEDTEAPEDTEDTDTKEEVSENTAEETLDPSASESEQHIELETKESLAARLERAKGVETKESLAALLQKAKAAQH